MKKLYCYLLLTLLICNQLQSQPRGGIPAKPKSLKATFYYDLSWGLTTPEKSFYRREAYFDFTDMVFDGAYRDFNKEDVLIAEGSYSHGKKTGFQTEYFPNRTLKSTIEFDGNAFTIWELKDGHDSIKNGTGKFTMIYFYLAGLVSKPSWKQGILNGEFRFGKRMGTWIYTDVGKNKTDEEKYENGKLITRVHFAETSTVELTYGKEIIISVNSLVVETLAYDKNTFGLLNEAFEQRPTYTSSFERTITYPGGVKKLLRLLAQNADVPEGLLCVVKIRVDERGKVVKRWIITSAGASADERVLKALETHEKKFFPAIKNGLPHPAIIFIPVSSGDEWIEVINTASMEEIQLIRGVPEPERRRQRPILVPEDN